MVQVQQLVSEGNDVFLSRRALAFAEGNLEDARAILIADKMDEEDEEQQQQQQTENSASQASMSPPQSESTSGGDAESDVLAQLRKEKKDKKSSPAPSSASPSEFKAVSVSSDFDPTMSGMPGGKTTVPAAAPTSGSPTGFAPPKPAKKSDVVFDATTADIPELVLESPVPVLVDIYADWCGPCKALTPALEDMAVKAGGAFRLVKVNTDNERAVSAALEVKALPTIFGVRDGKVLNSFQGMPKSEEAMKNFMMGLMLPGSSFDPPLTDDDKKRYAELTSKLSKAAGGAAFSFAARERLQNKMVQQLNGLVTAHNGDMLDAEGSAKTIRSLLSNIISKPDDAKYRKVNLQNKVIAAKIAPYPPCLSILKYVGFVKEGDTGSTLMIGKGKKVVNVAPLTIARDSIDKWVDRNRHTLAAAARKRKDEEERTRLAAEAAANPVTADEDEEEEETDPNAVVLKVRLEGKKKIHELNLQADDTLDAVLEALSVDSEDGENVQIVCAAKRMIVKASDDAAMGMSLRELSLFPAASIVVKTGSVDRTTSSSLKDRAATPKKKMGSHTMQSVGIYGKDDNAKGELVDGGGGTLYEQDVTDDEDEGETAEADNEEEEDVSDKTDNDDEEDKEEEEE